MGRKADARAYTVGRFTFYPAPLRLTEGSREVHLPSRQLKVLKMIVEAEGEPVPNAMLMDAVWEGCSVEPSNLTQTVFLLRRALGKLPDGTQYIETLPRVGYRLAPQALLADRPVTEASQSLYEQLPGGSAATEPVFRLLVESVAEYAIYMVDCAGYVCTWNRGAERNTGYSAAEVIGRHYSLFFTPEDIDTRLPDRELQRATKHGSFTGEGWRLRKDGGRFWAHIVVSAVRSESGKLLGFAKIQRDLTERKQQEENLLRMEALLRRERDRLSAAAESSLDAFFICEAVRSPTGEIEDFLFTYLNQNVEKMVKIPRERLLRSKMCEVLPINKTLGLFDVYKRVVLTRQPFVMDVPVDAEEVASEWVRIQAVPLEDGVAITASDRTLYKRLESAWETEGGGMTDARDGSPGEVSVPPIPSTRVA